MAHSAHATGDHYLNHTTGLGSWLRTLDHKRIGLMYLYTVLSYFLVGGLFALAIRLELMFPGRTLMDPTTYNRFFTFHGAIMVFMVIIPAIPAALGNFVLPMMVGAKDVAFPRLNLASYYIYVLGALIATSALFFWRGGYWVDVLHSLLDSNQWGRDIGNFWCLCHGVLLDFDRPQFHRHDS